MPAQPRPGHHPAPAPLTVRPAPCKSCPYRCDVPSGVWAPEEYERLREFDGDIAQQAFSGAVSVFLCHQTGQELCAGWVGHRQEPSDLLALRIGVADRRVDVAVMDYQTTVPLFRSGAEACEHGLRDLHAPSPAAVQVMHKVTTRRRDVPNRVR